MATENIEGKINQFDPNGVGLKNGQFIGLPFDYEHSSMILLPIPWDATVSYNDGTSTGPENVLQASSQLDLYDIDAPDQWKKGIYFEKISPKIQRLNSKTRACALKYIKRLESGKEINSKKWQALTAKVNQSCEILNEFTYRETIKHLQSEKIVGLIGGDHSTPLGFYKAYHEIFGKLGILVIDAHFDLRRAYEGFTYSHASIYYNALQSDFFSHLVQVGLRDFCNEEQELAQRCSDKIFPFSDAYIRNSLYEGNSWRSLCDQIASCLPQEILISIDIDGLLPYLCPNTGTPVAGGLEFNQVAYLIQYLVENGKIIRGFDVCEVAGLPYEWDGNVGARMVYKLINQTLLSQER